MLILIMTLFLMSDARAQDAAQSPAPTAKKSGNTNLFEQEAEPVKDKSKSFTAKVKVVREESDGVEVFFDGEKNGGAHYLYRSVEHYATHLKTLEASKKPTGTAVKVTVDADKRIKNVEKINAAEAQDPDKPWDFSKVPE